MVVRPLACWLVFASLPGASALGPTIGLYAWQRAIAGMSAFCAATIVSSPVDVLKCRMQVKQKNAESEKCLDLALSMLKKEGPIVFFSGMGPALLQAPAAMAQYTLMDPLRSMMPLYMAALIAGSIDIIIKCPFERVKTQMQGGGQTHAMSTVLRNTCATSGLVGLWAGLGATLARDLPYLVLKWLTYTRAQMLLSLVMPSATAANLVAGALAGAVAATAVTPADVIKTRVQTSGSKSGFLAVGREVFAEGGIPALFRGLGPRLLRIPIYTALTLATFDLVKDLFQAANEAGLVAIKGEL
jgi:hypothetical protein